MLVMIILRAYCCYHFATKNMTGPGVIENDEKLSFPPDASFHIPNRSTTFVGTATFSAQRAVRIFRSDSLRI